MSQRETRGSELYRCLAECAVQSVKHEYSKALGPGVLIDLNERVAEGLTLGDLLRDENGELRQGLFERVEPERVEAQHVPVPESGLEEEK